LRVDYEEAIVRDEDELKSITVFSLMGLGRMREARATLEKISAAVPAEGFEPELVRMIEALLDNDREAAIASQQRSVEADFPDPEGIYIFGRCVAFARTQRSWWLQRRLPARSMARRIALPSRLRAHLEAGRGRSEGRRRGLPRGRWRDDPRRASSLASVRQDSDSEDFASMPLALGSRLVS
jgi:hypothetical protein